MELVPYFFGSNWKIELSELNVIDIEIDFNNLLLKIYRL